MIVWIISKKIFMCSVLGLRAVSEEPQCRHPLQHPAVEVWRGHHSVHSLFVHSLLQQPLRHCQGVPQGIPWPLWVLFRWERERERPNLIDSGTREMKSVCVCVCVCVCAGVCMCVFELDNTKAKNQPQCPLMIQLDKGPKPTTAWLKFNLII